MLVMKWQLDGEGRLVARWIDERARIESPAHVQAKTASLPRRSHLSSARSRRRGGGAWY